MPRPFAGRGRRRLLLAAVPLVIVLLLAGCGKRGSPRPPLSRGPNAPKSVAARQIGRRAFVGFVVPQPKSERPSQQPVRAELVRLTYQAGFQPSYIDCSPIAVPRRLDAGPYLRDLRAWRP